MKQVRVVTLSMLMVLLCSLFGQAQQSATAANVAVPPLIQFSNVATDEGGNTLSGVVNITFSLYSSPQGGEPLWTETQNNVLLDPTGHYSVQLGITKQNGVPTTLFTTGEARWLGVRIAEQGEQPRVLLLSVPYALKAGDAATIGGLPPSAFVLAAPGTASAASAPTAFMGSTTSPADAPAGTDVTGSGTADFIPLWTTTSNIADSVLFQSGSGSTAKVGINTTTPATTLDVKGGGIIRGTLSLPTLGPATATAGNNSQPLTLAASAFSSTTSTPVNQTFQWLAEPAGNDTTAPSGTLNLLFGEGATKPSETGLNIASNGLITFATGQTFPGTGELNTANTFTGNQTVNGNITGTNVTATGVVSGSFFEIGGSLFAFGSAGLANAFLGFAGNAGTTGTYNTAAGYAALGLNTTGTFNTAVGTFALGNDNTGGANTGIGNSAGNTLDSSYLTGNNNIALGASTVFSTGTLTNATAIGTNAEVAESNAMVLGSINGVNGATASTNVGIGTTTPKAALDVAGNGLETYIGNPGCSSAGFAGIAFGNSGFASGCTNSALVGDGAGNTYLAAPTGSIVFRISNNATTAMKIATGGFVGIGTTSPSALLSVNGSANKPGGGSWETFSDGRLKNLNGSFSSGLSQILKLHPVRYRYKPDNGLGIHDTDEHIGVVAQEVQRVIPEAVTENSKGYLLVNNDPIIWSMVNAIKEQQGQIKQQKELLRAQAAAMRSLKAEVRETRETLRKVKAQVAAAQPALVAAK